MFVNRVAAAQEPRAIRTALLGKQLGGPALDELEALLVELSAERESCELECEQSAEAVAVTYLVEIEVHGGRCWE